MSVHVELEIPSHASPSALSQLRRERDLYAAGLSEITLQYEQKIRELSLLRRMSDVLRDSSRLDEVFRHLLPIIHEELGVAASSVYLADDSGELVLRARCQADGLVEIMPPGHSSACRIPPGSGPLGETFATGRVLVTTVPASGSPGWFPENARALLTAPLGPEACCMGVLALHDRDGDGVLEEAARLVPILATQATIAIENAALYRRLKLHSDTLEARVRERTSALEHLNAELQAVAAQKSRFFAQFSHELRTPLNSILGFSEMLQRQMAGPLNDRQQRYVRHVRDNGTQLLRLITDILDLAKVEAGKLSLQLRAMPLAPVIEQALAVMLPQANSKHLRLVRVVPSGLAMVRADSARIHQVLLNLLSNAIKFTPEGGTVTVSARPLFGEQPPGPVPTAGENVRPDAGESFPPAPESCAFVEVSVQDTGIGIAPEDQRRLFHDFEQAADGRHLGTGLGLSLTRRLVGLHGGQAGLESAPGEGSRFWFTLPVVARVAAPPEARATGGGEGA